MKEGKYPLSTLIFNICYMWDMKQSSNVNLKHALCYLPIAAIVIFFTENKRSVELNKHIKYGIFLLLTYVMLKTIIEWILWIQFLWGLLLIVYTWISGVLWYKAYMGENIDVEYIDKFEKKIKENLK